MKINGLLVLSFKNDDDDHAKNSFDDFCMLLVEINTC